MRQGAISETLEPRTPGAEIERHRTAIRRNDLSKPIRTAIEDQLINEHTTVLDYGCGHGDDVRNLSALGVRCIGWDPEFQRDSLISPSDVVNLGYVVNVIENPDERAEVLKSAWNYARKTLVVSARVDGDPESGGQKRFRDGCLTRLRTFQKFFEQDELRGWIEAHLGQQPVAAAPGVFYVFRSEEQRHLFVSSRYRRRMRAPRPRMSDLLFEKHRPLLEVLMSFFTLRGRLPAVQELAEGQQIIDALGSLNRAFAVVRRVTGSEQWDSISEERKKDLLVFLALAMFPKCPDLKSLPLVMQHDIRSFFRAYTNARSEARDLLFSVGKMGLIDSVCQQAKQGKLLPEALYVHVAGINMLPPELRVVEGCARVLAGRVEGATLVKFSRREPKITYLLYPEFDSDPHPRLAASLRVHLRTLKLEYQEFETVENPFILHRKETLVPADYPFRRKFERLTKQEEREGLFGSPETIGRRKHWQALLVEKGLCLRGHRLVRHRG
jgi:DNA phosphorothioation-associated putative methyltransferase